MIPAAGVTSIQPVAQVAAWEPEPGLPEMFMPSRLEVLAWEVGISDDDLRGLLRRLIAERVGWKTPRVTVTCPACGSEFEMSSRRARAAVVEQTAHRCPTCSRDLTPGPSEMAWLATLPAEVRDGALAAMSALAA